MISVTGCKDCPFCDANDMAPTYRCKLFTWEEQPEPIQQLKTRWEPKTPKWCPLKKESVTVTFKKRNVSSVPDEDLSAIKAHRAGKISLTVAKG